MKPLIAMLMFFLPAVAMAQPTRPAPLNISFAMSLDKVEITNGFRGAELIVFGAPAGGVGDDFDVVVTVTGPSGRATLRHKERVSGIWMFTGEAEFEWLPSFYTVATSGPLDQILDPVDDLQHGISPRAYIPPAIGTDTVEDSLIYTDAMHRLTDREGRVTLHEGIVDISEGVLFQTRMPLPVSLVPGSYNIRVFLLRGGQVVARSDVDLPVQRGTMQRMIYKAAQEHGVLYGIAAAVIAMVSGWLASMIFNRR